MTSETRTANCRTCATMIGWIDCPTGGWWAHDQHPDDGHDAVPGAWVDGDPLMEAIAAAVWEHCDTSGGYSIVTDDPRNIAATAAAVARTLIAAEVVEWSGRQIGVHVPTVDAVAAQINPRPAARPAL